MNLASFNFIAFAQSKLKDQFQNDYRGLLQLTIASPGNTSLNETRFKNPGAHLSGLLESKGSLFHQTFMLTKHLKNTASKSKNLEQFAYFIHNIHLCKVCLQHSMQQGLLEMT